jgi:uncharacterized membrane protein YbhN (UPF0104 family)
VVLSSHIDIKSSRGFIAKNCNGNFPGQPAIDNWQKGIMWSMLVFLLIAVLGLKNTKEAPDMIGQVFEKTRWRMICVAFFVSGFALAGCNFGNDTAAAQGRRIETFSIEPDSFILLTDSDPNIVVSDGATKYTLTSNGSVTFTGQTINLDPSEIVIERPTAGIVTVIRFQ